MRRYEMAFRIITCLVLAVAVAADQPVAEHQGTSAPATNGLLIFLLPYTTHFLIAKQMFLQ